MAKVKDSDFEKPVPVADDKDEATMATIDDTTGDAKAGRTIPAEEVRKMLPK